MPDKITLGIFILLCGVYVGWNIKVLADAFKKHVIDGKPYP